MSLLDKIEQMQKLPERRRKRILSVSVAVFMAVVIAIWITGIHYSFNESGKSEAKNAPKPFSIVLTSIANSSEGIIEKIKKEFKNIKSSVNNFAEMSAEGKENQ